MILNILQIQIKLTFLYRYTFILNITRVHDYIKKTSETHFFMILYNS